MAIATIPETILRGRISTYLSANNNANAPLFGARVSPNSEIIIAIVTDALDWGYTGGAQTVQSLREVANYAIWIFGKYGQQAQAIIDGGGGGSVTPGGGSVVSPKVIFGSDFANTTDWEYEPYAGKNLTVFSNGIADYLTFGTQWIYIPTGIRIIMDGFDSAQMDYFMVITIIR